MSFSFFTFSIVLGMRHGLDPDHLSIINGISLNHREGENKWNGFYFSLGHGVTITLIGIGIHFFSKQFSPDSTILKVTEWFPIIILLFTGSFGIFNLMKQRGHTHAANKLIDVISGSTFIPIKLFLTGILFALVFDTTSQITAWSLIGSSSNHYSNAIFIGIFFTIGMIITDTFNSFFFSKLLISKSEKINLFKILSVLIIFSSLFFGIIQLVQKLGFEFDLSDSIKQSWGILLVTITILGTIFNFIIKPKNEPKTNDTITIL